MHSGALIWDVDISSSDGTHCECPPIVGIFWCHSWRHSAGICGLDWHWGALCLWPAEGITLLKKSKEPFIIAQQLRRIRFVFSYFSKQLSPTNENVSLGSRIQRSIVKSHSHCPSQHRCATITFHLNSAFSMPRAQQASGHVIKSSWNFTVITTYALFPWSFGTLLLANIFRLLPGFQPL